MKHRQDARLRENRTDNATPEPPALETAEIGAIAHLYRGEVYRCTVWRTRLDTTTNWAVVTLGVALSISYASPQASPLPLVLVGISNLFFLTLEARRYRYCDLWRHRFRSIERNFYGPILTPGPEKPDPLWRDTLRHSYLRPEFRISYARALGRRIRRSYMWIMAIQLLAFVGKVIVHPTPVATLDEALARAAVGAISGSIMALGGVVYTASFLALAYWSARQDAAEQRRLGLPHPDAIY